MSSHLLQLSSVITSQLRTDVPEFHVGSLVEVHYKIKEGNRERIQVFSGIVTNRHKRKDLDATFTVLKTTVASIKVERSFPVHSPMIDKIVVVKLQRARKANLRFLRDVKDPVKTIRSKTVTTLA
jgi:large subunit ribosomal protein L19